MSSTLLARFDEGPYRLSPLGRRILYQVRLVHDCEPIGGGLWSADAPPAGSWSQECLLLPANR